jgi:protein-L-isoaspartate(D-aspartate) O-methyltransferase
MDFFSKLDRKEFLTDEVKMLSDLDCPLSIGFGQTISQPTLVLEMTILLDLDESHRVLEIGTGSGYQTAFLANFAKEIYTVELYEELSMRAQEVLNNLKYDNIHFKIGDGSVGWEEYAPYDRIIVTAAAGKMPSKLIDQLSPGGKLMIPVGSPFSQELLLIEKDERGNITKKVLNHVRFVEFVGEYGWK